MVKKVSECVTRNRFTSRRKHEDDSAQIPFEEAYDWETAAVMIHSMMESGESGLAYFPNEIQTQSLLNLCNNTLQL